MSNVCGVGECACLPMALLCPLQAVCQGTGPSPLPSILCMTVVRPPEIRLWLSSATRDPGQRWGGEEGSGPSGQGPQGDACFLHLGPISSQLPSVDQLLGFCHCLLLSFLQAESGNRRQ